MLPDYLAKAVPNPMGKRAPWYANTAPTYAGIFLWIAFYQQMAGGTLQHGGLGLCLAGGGALLHGLADRLADELHLRVWVAEDPLTCVVRGTGAVLDDFHNYSRLLVGLERGSTRHS